MKDKLSGDGFRIFLWADWKRWLWEVWVPFHFVGKRRAHASRSVASSACLEPGPGGGARAGCADHKELSVGAPSSRKAKRWWQEAPGWREDGKRSALVAPRRARRKGVGDRVRFSVCASDLSSQRKHTASLEGLTLANPANAIRWQCKNPNVSRHQGLGLRMPIALSLSVYTPRGATSSSNIFAGLLLWKARHSSCCCFFSCLITTELQFPAAFWTMKHEQKLELSVFKI